MGVEEPTQGIETHTVNVGAWWWGQCPKCKKVTHASNWTHIGKHRECRYMGVVGIHTGNSLCSQCGFNSLWGSIPSMGDLFVLRALSPPPVPIFTAFHCVGFNSLHGSPPLSCTYIPCVSLHGFNSLHRSLAPPCTYIHCVYCMGPIPCMGPHHQYSLYFPVWAPFTVWWPFCT